MLVSREPHQGNRAPRHSGNQEVPECRTARPPECQAAPRAETTPVPVDLSVDVAGIRMRNPVMTASGTFGYGREFEPYMDLNRDRKSTRLNSSHHSISYAVFC